MCSGDQFCFDAVFTDPDALDALVLSSNASDILPGATIVQTGSNPATATICWTFGPGYTGSIISINASDEVCPIPGFATFVVDLDIPPSLFPGGDSTAAICGSAGMVNLFDYIQGYYQNDGQWEDPSANVIADPTMVNTATAASGVYEYIVFADPAAGSCIASDTMRLTFNIGSVNVTTNRFYEYILRW